MNQTCGHIVVCTTIQSKWSRVCKGSSCSPCSHLPMSTRSLLALTFILILQFISCFIVCILSAWRIISRRGRVWNGLFNGDLEHLASKNSKAKKAIFSFDSLKMTADWLAHCTRIFSMWIPVSKFGCGGTIQYENGSTTQFKFYYYRLAALRQSLMTGTALLRISTTSGMLITDSPSSISRMLECPNEPY
jgi:hypothetical protein